MSFVTTQPEALSSAATALGGIGSSFSAQNAAAAAPTTGVVPAAADEVSALTAAQFAAHAQLYQAVAAQAAAIHEQFVNTLAPAPGRTRLPKPPTPPPRASHNFLSAGHRDGARPTVFVGPSKASAAVPIARHRKSVPESVSQQGPPLSTPNGLMQAGNFGRRSRCSRTPSRRSPLLKRCTCSPPRIWNSESMTKHFTMRSAAVEKDPSSAPATRFTREGESGSGTITIPRCRITSLLPPSCREQRQPPPASIPFRRISPCTTSNNSTTS